MLMVGQNDVPRFPEEIIVQINFFFFGGGGGVFIKSGKVVT